MLGVTGSPRAGILRDIKVSLRGKKAEVLVVSAKPGETIRHIREKDGFRKANGGDWKEIARFTAGTSYRLSDVENVLRSRSGGARLNGGVPFYKVGIEGEAGYKRIDGRDNQHSTTSETDVVFIEIYGDRAGGYLWESRSTINGYLEITFDSSVQTGRTTFEKASSQEETPSKPSMPLTASPKQPSFEKEDLVEGVAGLLPEELLMLKEQGLPKIALEKLKYPDKRLSIDESITCLTGCIGVGAIEAVKARAKDIVIFIGNTGAGKSTTVNYIHGCDMRQVKAKEMGQKGAGRIVIVAPESAVKPLMIIGHSKESQTFIPKIEQTPGATYCDCPGFMDNRGAEINIANAVNIKAAIATAKSVKVMVLINYDGVRADRGRGIRELIKLLSDLFGTESRLLRNRESVVIGVTKVPIGEDYTLEDIRDEICSVREDLTTQLRDQIQIFDPLERELEGGLSRRELKARLTQMPPIQNPSHIFQTVLTGDDEQKLRDIVDEMSSRVKKSLRDLEYENVKRHLISLKQLEQIDNAYVTRLIQTAMREVIIAMDQKYGEVQAYVLNKQYEVSDQVLTTMRELVVKVGGFNEFRYFEQAYKRALGFSEQSKENERLNEQIRKELSSLKIERKTLEAQIKRMEEAKEISRQEITQLETRLDKITQANSQEMTNIKAAFEREKDKLRTELQAAGEEDREQLQKALAQKEAEQSALLQKVKDQEAQQRQALEQTIAKNRENEKAKAKEIADLKAQVKTVEARKQAQAEQQRKAEAAAAAAISVTPASGMIPVQGGRMVTEAELSQRLGAHMYIGTSAYRKIGIEGITLPEIPRGMLEEIDQMKQEGLKPLMVYDHGISMMELDQRLKRHAPDTKFYNYWWQEESFGNKTGTSGWLVIPTSDDGVERGSRKKTFLQQEQEMNKRYRIATCREGALILLLTDVETSRKFFGAGTYGRTTDKTAAGFRTLFGGFDGSGLRICCNDGSFCGNFGLVVALRNS